VRTVVTSHAQQPFASGLPRHVEHKPGRKQVYPAGGHLVPDLARCRDQSHVDSGAVPADRVDQLLRLCLEHRILVDDDQHVSLRSTFIQPALQLSRELMQDVRNQDAVRRIDEASALVWQPSHCRFIRLLHSPGSAA
jgi:hypothetical protein